MTGARRDIAARIAVVIALALTAAGCAGFRSEPDTGIEPGQVQSTTETAPADLQLTCSSQAAIRFGLPADRVLPVSSSKLPDGTYRVQLSSDGQSYLCIVDNDANIINLSTG